VRLECRRRGFRALRAASLASALGSLLVGCATPGQAPAPPLPGADRLIVAPLNLAVKLPVELEDGVQPVRDAILAYLQRRNARVAVVWPSDAWELWQSAMAQTESVGNESRRLDKAVGLFVVELARSAEFSAFILPTLVYREAKLWGDTARWDGVRRKLPTRTRLTVSSRLSTLEPGLGDAQVRGAEVPGVSLHVLVFDREGHRIYEGLGGLDLVHAVLITGSKATGHGTLVQEVNPFRNPENLEEGVALALDGYSPDAVQ